MSALGPTSAAAMASAAATAAALAERRGRELRTVTKVSDCVCCHTDGEGSWQDPHWFGVKEGRHSPCRVHEACLIGRQISHLRSSRLLGTCPVCREKQVLTAKHISGLRLLDSVEEEMHERTEQLMLEKEFSPLLLGMAFKRALKRNDRTAIERLVGLAFRLEEEGFVAILQAAASRGLSRIVLRLLGTQRVPNRKHFVFAFEVAVTKGHEELSRDLLDLSQNPEEDRRLALTLIARSGNIRMMQGFFREGDQRLLRALLIEAAKGGRKEIVRFLLEKEPTREDLGIALLAAVQAANGVLEASQEVDPREISAAASALRPSGEEAPRGASPHEKVIRYLLETELISPQALKEAVGMAEEPVKAWIQQCQRPRDAGIGVL